MKNALIMIALLIAGQVSAQQALGEVIGEVTEGETSIPLVDARVYIEDGSRIYQAKTDIDGRFRISAVPAGKYMVNIWYDIDTMRNIPVNVPMDGFGNIGTIAFNSSWVEVGGDIIVSANSNEMKLIDGNLPVATLTAEEISVSPVKFDVKGLITSMSSNVQQTADGSLVFRGARKGDMIYMIDGVKTTDARSIPSVSIGYMQVYTGGLPAKYGDTLGGVVVIESKSYFDLYRAWESEQIRSGKM